MSLWQSLSQFFSRLLPGRSGSLTKSEVSQTKPVATKSTVKPASTKPNSKIVSAGIRNKNYLNVKGKGWKGQSGSDSRGHAIFSAPEYGIRAGIVLLRTYWTRHKLQTIAAILSRWAPVTDTVGSLPNAPKNSPREYSHFVSSRMNGFSPTEKLSIFKGDGSIRDKDQLKALVKAMSAYEIGGGFTIPDDEFERALSLF